MSSAAEVMLIHLFRIPRLTRHLSCGHVDALTHPERRVVCPCISSRNEAASLSPPTPRGWQAVVTSTDTLGPDSRHLRRRRQTARQ